MEYSKLRFSLVVFFTALFIQLAAGVEPVLHTCTSYQNFTPNSEYDIHLRFLLGDLKYKTPITGYEYDYVVGKNDTVYGSALCRGDVSRTDCTACVFEAAQKIREICPYNIAANVWYEYCFLEYSNFNSYGYPRSTGFFLRSDYNVSSPLTSLAEIQKLLTQLSDEASASTKLFAKGVAKLEGTELNVYGLAQCPLDLSSGNCSTCINDRIDGFSHYFDGKGAQFLSVTCNVRYEFFPFFKD